MMGCKQELWAKINHFSPTLLFIREIYHSNGKETKTKVLEELAGTAELQRKSFSMEGVDLVEKYIWEVQGT